MQTTDSHSPRVTAKIGKYHPTAIIWVSRGRYTYTTSDCRASGHFADPNERRFRRHLSLEVHSLQKRGYFVRLQNATIEEAS